MSNCQSPGMAPDGYLWRVEVNERTPRQCKDANGKKFHGRVPGSDECRCYKVIEGGRSGDFSLRHADDIELERKAHTWQPMSTALRDDAPLQNDRTRILGLDLNRCSVIVYYTNDKTWMSVDDSDCWEYEDDQLLAWHPLPDAPTEAELKELMK